MQKKIISAVVVLILAAGSQAYGYIGRDSAKGNSASTAAKLVPSSQTEVAFSPGAGSEALVVKVIDSTSKSLYLAAYSFTSPAVVQALLQAKKRGVNVRVVVDEKGNKSKASIAALNLLVGAKIPTRTISVYAIHHDKYIVADEETVETGSFNYSKAAATANSENVIVIWKNPTLAVTYLDHWRDRWNKAETYTSSY
jgi:phosphatidylserine/phosphatidylglycerophosphate/cardiolipin synthase-like enzyme